MIAMILIDNILVLLVFLTITTISIHFILKMNSKPRKKEYKIILAKTIPNNVSSSDLIKNYFYKLRNNSKKN